MCIRDRSRTRSLSVSEIGTGSSSDEYGRLANDTAKINFACANARSLVHKIGSLITLFEENSLHFAIITETWLSKKHCPPRMLSDLTVGSNITLLRKDRGSRGGGVAICFDPTKMKMNAYNAKNTKGETVYAVGNSSLTMRKIVVVSVYLPPSMKVDEVDLVLEDIATNVDRLKLKFRDPIIFVGGDFNKKSLLTLLTAVPELVPIRAGATRRGVPLDEIYCNIGNSIVDREVLRPLAKEDVQRAIIA